MSTPATTARPPVAAQVEDRVNRMPVIGHLGMHIRVTEAGAVHARLGPAQDFHWGGQEGRAINGPILMGLLDCAMTSSAIVRCDGARCATLEFSVRLIRPALSANVVAIGSVLAVRGDILFCEGRVLDERQRVLVTASGTVKRVEPPVRPVPSSPSE